MNDEAKKGQKVAIQRGAFGDVVHEYIAGADGRVAIIGTDAICERNVDIVTILTNSSECPADGCPYHGDAVKLLRSLSGVRVRGTLTVGNDFGLDPGGCARFSSLLKNAANPLHSHATSCRGVRDARK